MAKRKKKKSATALFEVMSAGKSLELPVVRSRPLVQPPSWWTRWRTHRAAVAEARADRAAELAAVAPPVIEDPAPVVEVKPEPTVVAAAIADPESPSGKPYSFKIDFTTGVIVASGLVCFVGLTFLISNKIGNPARPPMMAATQTQQPPNRGVIDVPRPGPQPVQQQPTPEDHPPVIDPQPQNAATPGKRVINMNYVVIQSFPDEKIADDGAEYLKKNGIDCTVIQSLPRWTNKTQWYSIVGTKPFPPRSTGTAAYEAYVTQIKDAGVKFAGKSKWNRFEPQPYRWGADSEK